MTIIQNSKFYWWVHEGKVIRIFPCRYEWSNCPRCMNEGQNKTKRKWVLKRWLTVVSRSKDC